MYKKLSASGGLHPLTPHQGFCPWTPLGALPPEPPFRLVLRALAMVPPSWQILDPPLTAAAATTTAAAAATALGNLLIKN